MPNEHGNVREKRKTKADRPERMGNMKANATLTSVQGKDGRVQLVLSTTSPENFSDAMAMLNECVSVEILLDGTTQQRLDFEGEKDSAGGDNLVGAPATTDGPMPPKPDSLKGKLFNEEEQQVVDTLIRLCSAGGPDAEVTVVARTIAATLGWEEKKGVDKARRVLNKLVEAGEIKKNADGQFCIILKGEQ